MDITLIIPARYASTRLLGKPLIKIAGKEMLLRVWEIAQIVKKNIGGNKIETIVATDDARIAEFCNKHNIKNVMTSVDCATGTDRVMEVIKKLDYRPKFVVNLQGDNPLCPPWFIEELINTYKKDPTIEVVTPVVTLSWEELDKLRENKKATPTSGTCTVVDKKGDAMYFSKQIIPAIKKEDEKRKTMPKSPVKRHIGLYGYSIGTLLDLPGLTKGYYEAFESLEQLRFLENGIKIKCVEVDYKDRIGMSGIDALEDIARAEEIIKKCGEFK